MRRIRKAGVTAALLAAAVLAGIAVQNGQKDPLQSSIASKILRFHVLANSDSKEDQELKLLVRDSVGAYLAPLLEEAADLEETEEIVYAHLDEITQTAREEICAQGYTYEVTAQLTVTNFPEKTYGDYTFPEGEYEALQIIIGEGEGHNWWCVLYPNMCFRGSIYEIVSEDAGEALKEILSPEEYEDVFSSGRVQVRFRFLEWFS